jgi:hypothetical protein
VAVAVAVAGIDVAVGETTATEAAVGVAVGTLAGVAAGAVVPPRQAASKLASAPAIIPTNVRRETAGGGFSAFFPDCSSNHLS